MTMALPTYPTLGAADGGIVNATQWIVSLLTGKLPTLIAVVAIGIFGFSLLAGHLPIRRGIEIIVGCFILFSAPSLAETLTSLSEYRAPTKTIMFSGEDFASDPPARVYASGNSARGAGNPFDPYPGTTPRE